MVTFSDLGRAEIDRILTRNRIGRIAYIGDHIVELLPINFVYRDGWIYGRTPYGEKIARLRTNWWVAFEVDEVEDVFDWRSVVVHGGFYNLSQSHSADIPDRRALAIEALRTIIPNTLLPDDPVPLRTVVFGIFVQEVTGRSATSCIP